MIPQAGDPSTFYRTTSGLEALCVTAQAAMGAPVALALARAFEPCRIPPETAARIAAALMRAAQEDR